MLKFRYSHEINRKKGVDDKNTYVQKKATKLKYMLLLKTLKQKWFILTNTNREG